MMNQQQEEEIGSDVKRIAHSRKFSAFSRWRLVALGLLLALTTVVGAQELADESTLTATQVTFNFVQTPDVSSIGSLAADSENDIWATSVIEPVALHFDGTHWKKVPMANASRINKVAVLSPANVWAVGQAPKAIHSQIQHFDGSNWTVVASPHFKSGETLNSLKAISANSIFAVGASNHLDGRIPLVEHFDGTAWSVVPVPHIAGGELFDIAIISPSYIWVVGGSANPVLTMHFDGNQWNQVPAPGDNSGLFAVAALSTKHVWAVGSQLTSGPLIEHWDGTAWKVVSNPGALNTLLNSISAISPTDIWAAGCNQCADAGVGAPPLIEHWDGTQWNINSAPIEERGETANAVLTFPSRHIYIGGFAFASFGPTSMILKGVEGQ
jgi:hypothetical protein